MKHLIALRCVMMSLLAVIAVHSDAAELRDSLDVKIRRALDRAYEEFYFEDYTKAAAAFDQQSDIAAKAGRWHIVVSAMVLKANCAYNHYLADKTYSTLLEVEAIARNHTAALDSLDPVHEYRSEIHYVRGMHFHEAGDFIRSINSFQVIIENQRRYKGIDPQYLYYVYSFIGHANLQMMLFDKAYLNYEEALANLSEGGGDANSYQHAMISLYRGQCKEYKAKYFNDIKLAAEARTLYKRALRMFLPYRDKISYRGALTSAYTRLSALSSLMGKYDSAIYYLGMSQQYQAKDDPTLSLTYADQAALYEKQHDYKNASDYFDKAITIARKSYAGNHFQKGIPVLRKAEMLLNQNDPRGALTECQYALTQFASDFNDRGNIDALPPVDTEADVSLLLDALTLKGRIYFDLFEKSHQASDLDLSLRCYRNAIATIHDAQKKYPDAEYKQNLAAKAQPLYEYALDAAFSRYESNPGDSAMKQMIFFLMESNKSTMLRDASSNTMALHFEGVPNALLENESLLKGSMASMRAQLHQSPGDTAAIKWKRDLFTLTNQYDSIVGKIAQQYPKYSEFRYGGKIISLDEVQRTLSPETMLVEYFWGERSVYVFGLNQSDVVIRKLPIDNNLTSDMRLLISSITHHRPTVSEKAATDFSTLSHSVYRRLLEPALASATKESMRSLVIIPDGILSYVPFEIMVTATDKNTGFGDLSYLLKQYSIRSLFSASELSDRHNPVEYSRHYVGFAPLYNSTRGIAMTASDGMLHPVALTYNEEEVNTAARIFDGSVFVAQHASEYNFRKVSADSKVLHLSMHGVVNDNDPSFSALLFTQPDSTNSSDSDNDGLLYLHELYNVRVNTELAVLSACETGSGRYARGEGLMSLGRAFRYAGCANILMSLWKVNDNTTARLMKSLFYNLNEGQTKDEALRQAKLSFIAAPENKYFTHPYYWSGFVLVGDPAPVFDKSTSVWMWAAVLSLASLLLMTVIYFRRK